MENFQQNPESRPAAKPAGSLSTAALVTGILGLFAFFIPPLQFALGIVTIVLVIFASRRQKPMSAMAGAGLVLGIESIVASILVFMYLMMFMNILKANPELMQQFNQLLQ